MERTGRGPRWRAALLILAGTVIGALLISPASGHVSTPGHLWKTHIRPKADTRYLQNSKVWVSASQTVNASSTKTADANCPAGWQAVGGGIDFNSGASADVRVVVSAPIIEGDNMVAASTGRNPAATGWRVQVANDVGVSYTFVVGVICTK